MENPKQIVVKKTGPVEPKATEKELTVIATVSLSAHQNAILAVKTPSEYIKVKPARGGKQVKYVEGGYVTYKLNEAFGPLNWGWCIVEHGKTERQNEGNTEGEVWVRGRLTIKDHVNGYTIEKEGFGQHNIHKGVPYGDALKAASTDAFKKTAAQGLGIALDVYWGSLDVSEKPKAETQEKVKKSELFEKALSAIRATKNPQMLEVLRGKIQESKLYTQAQKIEMFKACNDCEKEIEKHSPKFEEHLPIIKAND